MTAAPPFRMRSLGWSVYLPTFLFAVGQGATIPVIPLFATNLGASVALASLIVGLRGFGTMVFDLPSGALVSRFGERWAMLIGTLALGIVAAVSYGYEKFKMSRQLMMTRQEVKEEHRQAEGDAHSKAAMRRMARQIGRAHV